MNIRQYLIHLTYHGFYCSNEYVWQRKGLGVSHLNTASLELHSQHHLLPVHWSKRRVKQGSAASFYNPNYYFCSLLEEVNGNVYVCIYVFVLNYCKYNIMLHSIFCLQLAALKIYEFNSILLYMFSAKSTFLKLCNKPCAPLFVDWRTSEDPTGDQLFSKWSCF